MQNMLPMITSTNTILPITIPFKKLNLILFSLFGIVFFVGSYMILVEKAGETHFLISDRFTRSIIGIAGLLFSGIITFHFIKKLFQSKPALIIDNDGLIDHSSAFTVGRVYWNEIFAIEETVFSTSAFSKEKTIAIILCDPNAFVEKYNSKFAKKIMELNNKTLSTPYHISSRALAIRHDELLALLQKCLIEHQ